MAHGHHYGAATGEAEVEYWQDYIRGWGVRHLVLDRMYLHVKTQKYAVEDEVTILRGNIERISGKGEPDGKWAFTFFVDKKRRDGGGTYYCRVSDEAAQQRWMSMLAGDDPDEEGGDSPQRGSHRASEASIASSAGSAAPARPSAPQLADLAASAPAGFRPPLERLPSYDTAVGNRTAQAYGAKSI